MDPTSRADKGHQSADALRKWMVSMGSFDASARPGRRRGRRVPGDAVGGHLVHGRPGLYGHGPQAGEHRCSSNLFDQAGSPFEFVVPMELRAS